MPASILDRQVRHFPIDGGTEKAYYRCIRESFLPAAAAAAYGHQTTFGTLRFSRSGNLGTGGGSATVAPFL